MNMEDVILVTTVREEIRGGVLRVDVADIPHHVVKAMTEAQPEKIEAEIMAKAEPENEVKVVAREKREAKVKAEAGEDAKAAEAKSELEAKKEGPCDIAPVAASSVPTEGSRVELTSLPGAPMKHLLTASSIPQGPTSTVTHLARPRPTPITAAPSLTRVVWRERKLTGDKQVGKWSWLTMSYFDRWSVL